MDRGRDRQMPGAVLDEQLAQATELGVDFEADLGRSGRRDTKERKRGCIFRGRGRSRIACARFGRDRQALPCS